MGGSCRYPPSQWKPWYDVLKQDLVRFRPLARKANPDHHRLPNRPSDLFPKGSTALKDAFDEGLAAIKADGTYDQIYAKWFGEAPK